MAVYDGAVSAPLSPEAHAQGRTGRTPTEPSAPGASALTLGALGVVFGDIGTSPLYAFRACIRLTTDGTPTPAEVLGILSLIVWALVLVVSVKYLALVVRADNQGEGGVLALAALALGGHGQRVGGPRRGLLLALGMTGAALLYGDGAITPAISVLSAVEGLGIVTDRLDPWVLPITVLLLAGLFGLQSRGTGRISRLFGPAMALWFIVIGALGAATIVREPGVLAALDPRWAVRFMAEHASGALTTLTGVVLAVTGAEALYADLGHFGRRPIQRGWYAVVLPGLLLNYLGQGALLLQAQTPGDHPFYDLAPSVLRLPLVVLATLATVIASQALITGAFSLTQQAVHLRLLPRLGVIHTSRFTRGRIYLPAVNWTLAALSIGIVIGFRTSNALAAAYGIAVTGTMVVTSLLFAHAARARFGWPRMIVGLVTSLLLAIDLPFFVANLDKLDSGGWVPLGIATTIFVTMDTWQRGWRALERRLSTLHPSLDAVLDGLERHPAIRLPGTAVYLTSNLRTPPLALLSDLLVRGALHERVVLLSMATVDRPRVSADERVEVEALRCGFVRGAVHVGFTENLRLDDLVAACAMRGLPLRPDESWYLVSRLAVLPGADRALPRWRTRFFGVLLRNASSLVDSLQIPDGRFVELRIRVDL